LYTDFLAQLLRPYVERNKEIKISLFLQKCNMLTQENEQTKNAIKKFSLMQ